MPWSWSHAAPYSPISPRLTLQVWELDKLAGFYTTKKADNFHVPNKASAQAAMAALLLLRLGVGARGGQQLRNCSAAPPLPPAPATS